MPDISSYTSFLQKPYETGKIIISTLYTGKPRGRERGRERLCSLPEVTWKETGRNLTPEPLFLTATLYILPTLNCLVSLLVLTKGKFMIAVTPSSYGEDRMRVWKGKCFEDYKAAEKRKQLWRWTGWKRERENEVSLEWELEFDLQQKGCHHLVTAQAGSLGPFFHSCQNGRGKGQMPGLGIQAWLARPSSPEALGRFTQSLTFWM